MPIPVGGLGQHYDIDADDYFSAHDESQRTENARALLAKAETLLGRKGRLLDIGVGRGEILIAASKRGWYVEGVEPSSTFAKYVESRAQVKVWQQPVEEAEIAPNSFDVVLLAAVLEHLYDPDRIIRRISEILVAGGLLYVDVPNEAGLYFKVGNASQRLRGRDWCINLAPTFSPYHVFGFSPKALKALLAKHGLKPEVWNVYSGTSLLPTRKGIIGKAESIGSRLVTALSGFGDMGTYIETWARKR
jgi:SAM-dependent methyltransferase